MRGERPLDVEDGPLARFATDLRLLRAKAGGPAYRELSRRAHYSAAALSEAASGRKLPSLSVTLAYVAACGGDTAEWERRWHSLAATLADSSATKAPSGDDVAQPPYVGLAAFQAADAGKFFGRERLVAQLRDMVSQQRFVMLVGPSGSGKSSLLHAGLLHHVQAHGLHGVPDGPTMVMAPGPHPLQECAVRLAALVDGVASSLHRELWADPRCLHLTVLQALADQPSGVDLLVVVDQFEEVFTLCRDADERARFLTVLVTAAQAANSRIRIVLGVRADFYAHCAHYPQLVEVLREAQILVGPMSAAELRTAITQPAIDAGCRVETALVSEILTDAAGQPGVLPLVSHALLETWRRRRGTTLTLAGYQAVGRIEEAITRTAETVYTSLSADQQRWARQLFTRLVALGEGTEDTKRRLDRTELDQDDPHAAVVLEQLVRARLVTLDRDSVQVTHEALVRCWPRLRGWLTEDREGLRVHRQLTEATNEWERLNHDRDALYRGARLSQASQWASTNGEGVLNTRERAFLQASLSAQARGQAIARRRTRRLRQLLALLTVLLVVATTATAFALRARQSSIAQRNLAIAQKVLSQAAALRATNPALALQLTLAAYRLAPVPEARNSMLNLFSTPYATRLTGHADIVHSVAFSPDGHTLASASDDKTVRLWDLTNPSRPQELTTLTGFSTPVVKVAFSADGRTLATGSGDASGVRLWDVTDPHHPRQLASLLNGTAGVGGHGYMAFSPVGHLLAAVGKDDAGRGTIHLWDIADREHPRELPSRAARAGYVYNLAFSADGETLAAAAMSRASSIELASHEVQLWNVSNPSRAVELTALTGYKVFLQILEFSPRGHVLAVGEGQESVRLWSLENPRQPKALSTLTGFRADVSDMAFSPDGQTIAAAGTDRTIRVWDVTNPRQPQVHATLTGATSTVTTVAFSPDGRSLATGSIDSLVRLEDVSEYASSARAHAALNTLDVADGGRLLATGHVDGTVRLWDITDRYVPRSIASFVASVPADRVEALTFSPDGHTLATSSWSGVGGLWDVTDPGRPTKMATMGTSNPNYLSAETPALAFSPDGRTLATSSDDRSMQLWSVSDLRHPRMLANLTERSAVRSVAFSPDGRLLAAAGKESDIALFDVTDPGRPRLATTLAQPSPSLSVAFSPNAPVIAAATNNDRTVRLWDATDTDHPRLLSTLTSTTFNLSIAFSRDGRAIAGGGADGTVGVWGINDPRRPSGFNTLTALGPVWWIDFNPDNHTLVTGSTTPTASNRPAPHRPAQLWETDMERIAARICQVVWPRINQAEWHQYFPEIGYRPPCP